MNKCCCKEVHFNTYKCNLHESAEELLNALIKCRIALNPHVFIDDDARKARLLADKAISKATTNKIVYTKDDIINDLLKSCKNSLKAMQEEEGFWAAINLCEESINRAENI